MRQAGEGDGQHQGVGPGECQAGDDDCDVVKSFWNHGLDKWEISMAVKIQYMFLE